MQSNGRACRCLHSTWESTSQKKSRPRKRVFAAQVLDFLRKGLLVRQPLLLLPLRHPQALPVPLVLRLLLLPRRLPHLRDQVVLLRLRRNLPRLKLAGKNIPSKNWRKSLPNAKHLRPRLLLLSLLLRRQKSRIKKKLLRPNRPGVRSWRRTRASSSTPLRTNLKPFSLVVKKRWSFSNASSLTHAPGPSCSRANLFTLT